MITQMTREEYEKKYGTTPVFSSTSSTNVPKNENQEVGGVQSLGVGIAKGALSTAQGLGQLTLKGVKAITGKDYGTKETFFQDPNTLKAQGTAEKIGKFGEQVAEFALPGGAVSKATKALPFIARTGAKALTSGAVATAQSGEIGKESAIAAGTEAAIPIVGKIIKPAVKFMRTLLKGTGSALSGAPAEAIEQIYKNPKIALQTAKEIRKTGGAKILEKNALTVREGIAGIKSNARKLYGEGLEQLKKEDIDPTKFRGNIQPTLDKFGVISEKGTRKLGNVEFTEPKNIKKATELINKINKAELDGVSLRKLADDIENSKFKTATSDERLSFNAFIKDLSDSVKNAINSSTNKLNEINETFSGDMQLAEATEDILGDVKYTKNLGEINKTAKKLEALFTEKGLDPKTVDDFLEKIGISSGGFKSTEAIRQLSEKSFSVNTMGTSPFEIIRAFTASVVSPKMVGQIAARLGLAENIVKEMSEKLSPATRGVIIKLLTNSQQQ